MDKLVERIRDLKSHTNGKYVFDDDLQIVLLALVNRLDILTEHLNRLIDESNANMDRLKLHD